jgi:hypothetical protein
VHIQYLSIGWEKTDHDSENEHEETNVIEEGGDHDPTEDEELHLGDNCLKQLYPDLYEEECDQFRILERAARLYINFLGVRRSPGMSSSAFRMFIR